MTTNVDLKKLKHEVEISSALLLFFSTASCSVCVPLKQKLKEKTAIQFPLLRFKEISLNSLPEAKGTYSVFTAPTILVFFEGKEFFRRGGSMSITELTNEIEKPYTLLFGQ